MDCLGYLLVRPAGLSQVLNVMIRDSRGIGIQLRRKAKQVYFPRGYFGFG